MKVNKLKWFIIKLNIFKYTFPSVAGFIYIENNKPVKHITDRVTWLGNVDVYCRYKDINKKAIEAFHNLYPEYKGYINII